MNDDRATTRRRTSLTYWLLIAGQWLVLTLALTGAMVRSSQALRDYVSPNVSDGWLLACALVTGLLFGVTVISPKVLFPLAITACLVAAAIFGLVIYMPAWQGTLFRSTSLANYAQQQALFFWLWTTIPAIIGGMIGYLVAGSVRRALEIQRDGPVDDHTPWWERPSRNDARNNPNP